MMKSPTTIAILGNCQTAPYKFILAARLPAAKVDVFVIHTIPESEWDDVFKRLGTYDLIITQLITDKFGVLSTESLKKSYGNRTCSIVNVFFRGLHPDFQYKSLDGKKISSPVGDYHSEIAYDSYSEGLSVEACLNLYTKEHFLKLGYHNAWDKSLDELKERKG